MAHKYTEVMFTDNIKNIQEREGSRKSYARFEEGDDYHHLIGPKEAEFISDSDSFYMASVSETGWPYVQHRGGPKGFLKIIDEGTIGFSDFRGNKQYISLGNFQNDNRVSLFFMDYKNKRRLKMIGRISLVDEKDSGILKKLSTPDYRSHVERAFIVTIEGFDWNCPQHITPRYTEEDIQPLLDRISELENDEVKS